MRPGMRPRSGARRRASAVVERQQGDRPDLNRPHSRSGTIDAFADGGGRTDDQCRQGWPSVTRAGTAVVAGYLAAERDLGRVAADADTSTLAPTLIGTAHLLFTDADGTPEPAVVARVAAAVLAAALRPP